MMPIALIVLGRASGGSSLVTSIVGLIVVGIGDCKVPSVYPCQISSKGASSQSVEMGRRWVI